MSDEEIEVPDVFLCDWKKTEKGIKMWVIDEPECYVEGDSDPNTELCDEFAEEVGDHFMVTIPYLTFRTEFPRNNLDRPFSEPMLYTLTSEGDFDLKGQENSDDFSPYYHGSHCDHCGSPTVQRNEAPLVVTDIEDRFDMVCNLRFRHTITIYSQEFLQLLPDQALQLQWREIDNQSNSKRKYFELIGPTGLPTVGITEQEHDGWECPACGQRVFGYSNFDDSIFTRFIAYADLPQPVPSVFTVEDNTCIELVMTESLWIDLFGKAGMYGISSSPLGVSPDQYLVRHPVLKMRKKA